MMRKRGVRRGATVGADKTYDTTDFVTEIHRRGLTLHMTQNDKHRRSTRHEGYRLSLKVRKRIEKTFGWIKTVSGMRRTNHRGTTLVDWMFTLKAIAYNLVRRPRLLTEVA